MVLFMHLQITCDILK